jgi:hypothetical protein
MAPCTRVADTEDVSWIRWSIAIGALVLLISFAAGTEDMGSVSYHGQTYSCGGVLTFDYASSRGSAAPDERPAAVVAKCRPLHLMHVAGVWGGIGLGTLAILVGWTVSREREDVEPADSDSRVAV